MPWRTRVDCDGRGLFIHRANQVIQVYDSRCPHQSTNIPHLALHGTTLTCPRHQWKFDIATGECIDKGDSPLKRLESRVRDGRLEDVRLQDRPHGARRLPQPAHRLGRQH